MTGFPNSSEQSSKWTNAFDPVTGTAGAARLPAQTRIIGAAVVGFQYDVAPGGRFIVSVLTNDAALWR